MFDDLHDPNPPQPDVATLNTVLMRAGQRRRRRRATSIGLAAVIAVAGGVGIATATGGSGDGSSVIDQPPLVTDTEPPPPTETTSAPAPPPPSVPSVATTAPDPTLPLEQLRYLALGDSVMLGAAPTLASMGVVIDANVTREVVEVIPVVEELRRHRILGGVVIIHLGNDAPVAEADLDRLLGALDEVPNVLVLTSKASHPWTAATNEVLRSSSDHSNVILVDWALRAAECPGDCFASDGIHLRVDGQRYYSQVIGDVLGLSVPNPATFESPSAHPQATPLGDTLRSFVDSDGLRCLEVATSPGGAAGACFDDDFEDLGPRSDIASDGTVRVFGATNHVDAAAVVATFDDGSKQTTPLFPIDDWPELVFGAAFDRSPVELAVVGSDGRVLATAGL